MQKSYVGPDGTEMRCLRCGQVEWESASRVAESTIAAPDHFEIAGPWELETTEDGTLTITTPTHVIVVRDVERLEVEPPVTKRVELRPDHEGVLDDVVVNGVKMFRLERMSKNHWWGCCYLPGYGLDRVNFEFHASRKDGLTVSCTEVPRDAGDFTSGEHGFVDRGVPDEV